jgi:16S rRNA (cytosine967-C5)-methyltransferase
VRNPDARRRHAPVRRLAARIVLDALEGRGAARTLLDRTIARERFGPRESALLTELVYGTVREAPLLDALLDACSARGLERTPAEVLAALRVAAHQLVFLEHVPPAVAVSEAVDEIRAPHLRKFANGLLRAVGRLVAGRSSSDEPPGDVPPTRRLPGRERGWVLLAEDVLPDLTRDPASWLALATAHPLELARGWIARFGFERALEVCRAGNAPAPVVLRANLVRTARDTLVDELRSSGIVARAGGRPEAIVLEGAGEVTKLACFREGRASVQDETAMSVAPLLGHRPGERVLDLCAAPGGKATHLAELRGDRGLVVATDASGARLERVRENVARLGLLSVWVAAEEEPPGATGFDAVLADVPCSNTGVLRRRVEVRSRLSSLERASLLALQARLLRVALARTAPGSRLVYSTCSIEEPENEAQVRALLAERPDEVALESDQLVLPHRGGGDGGYAALLRRRPF